MKDIYKVYRIENGTVIDHLPSGTALNVLKIIGVSSKDFVAIGMNLESSKLGKKDLIKYENKFLVKDETDKLALLAPGATINIIKDSKVVEKRKISIPAFLKNIIKCKNPNCICNKEKMETEFYLVDEIKKQYRCKYCEREYLITDDFIL
ncbi:MAG: aspartate carbamoyltransferase regulatory subunit [Exilispira sp.]